MSLVLFVEFDESVTVSVLLNDREATIELVEVPHGQVRHSNCTVQCAPSTLKPFTTEARFYVLNAMAFST